MESQIISGVFQNKEFYMGILCLKYIFVTYLIDFLPKKRRITYYR